MPDQQPTIIVNQSQRQEGCLSGCWSGCSLFVGLFVLIAILGIPFVAATGEYGIGWQIVSIGGLVIVALVLIGLLITFLDNKFGWGLTDSSGEQPPAGEKRSPEDILSDRE